MGKQFVASVQQATTKICINPLAFRVIESDVRRCLMARFPYGVLFRIRKTEIVVIAIMHLHRDPMYWIDRRDQE